MAIIIAALFLPYTVGFFNTQTSSGQVTVTGSTSTQNSTPSPESEQDNNDGHQATRLPSPLSKDNDGPDTGHQVARLPPQSLTSQTAITIPSRSHNGSHGRSRSLQLVPTFTRSTASLPLRTSSLMPQTPGAATNSDSIFRLHNQTVPLTISLPDKGLVRNKSAASLQTLSALDAQDSTWGNVPHLNQPKSMAVPPPSRQIEDVGLEEKMEDLNMAPKVEKTIAKDNSQEELDYTTDNYSILPTTLGNAGLYAAILGLASKGHIKEKTWIGTLGMPTDALSQEVKEHMEGKLLIDHDCIAVYVNDTAMSGHYENYCKTTLWPTFHCEIPIQPESKAYEEDTWSHYMAVNQAFADKIVENWKQDDMIWIQDYHLLLVPGLIRQKVANAKIGLFIHSAFPPSEVFKILPSRKDLLGGMLGANLIAFQTKDFRHQFLQTCTSVLNLQVEKHGVVLDNGRFVDVRTIPMGIDLDSMNARRQLPTVTDDIDSFLNQFQGKHIIFARDKLDVVSGLKHKLRGYEKFLTCYPEWKHKVVLVQVAPYASQDNTLRHELHDLIESINRQFGAGPFNYQPINYWTVDLDYSQYLALLSVADCMLVTGLCDGMNLTCHEFIACQDGAAGGKGHAPLVLSMFAGAAEVFGHHALLVNPYHPQAIADHLHEALKRSVQAKKESWTNLYALVKRNSALSWYKSFSAGLEKAWNGQFMRDLANIPRLQVLKLREQYQRSQKRLLIIDLEGTLTNWNSTQDNIITISKRVTDILNELMDDDRNIVYVTSQRRQKDLEHMLRMVPNIGLIAENGLLMRLHKENRWVVLFKMRNIPKDRGSIKDMLHSATLAIPGSWIIETESGFIFQYDNSQSDGHAGNLASRINDMCKALNIEAYPFEGGLRIHDKVINKTAAARYIYEDMIGNKLSFDLVFIVGNSEDLFRLARELVQETKVKTVVTCVVGKRHTDATSNLGSISAVLSTLETMVKVDAA